MEGGKTMSVQYHFICKPVENIRGFEYELNKMIKEGWRVKEDAVPRIIRNNSKNSDELLVTLVKEFEAIEQQG